MLMGSHTIATGSRANWPGSAAPRAFPSFAGVDLQPSPHRRSSPHGVGALGPANTRRPTGSASALPRLLPRSAQIPPQAGVADEDVSLTRARTFSGWPQLASGALSRLRMWLEFVPSPFFVPLLAFGIFTLRDRARALWLWLPSIVLFILLLGFHARLPQYLSELIPAVGLAAGLGAERILSIFRAANDRPRTAVLATAAFAALILLDAFFFGDVDPMPLALVILSLLIALVCAASSLGRSAPFARALLAASLAIFFIYGFIDARHDKAASLEQLRSCSLQTGRAAHRKMRRRGSAPLRADLQTGLRAAWTSLHRSRPRQPRASAQQPWTWHFRSAASSAPAISARETQSCENYFPSAARFSSSENLELRELDPIDPKPQN